MKRVLFPVLMFFFVVVCSCQNANYMDYPIWGGWNLGPENWATTPHNTSIGIFNLTQDGIIIDPKSSEGIGRIKYQGGQYVILKIENQQSHIYIYLKTAIAIIDGKNKYAYGKIRVEFPDNRHLKFSIIQDGLTDKNFPFGNWGNVETVFWRALKTSAP